MVLNYTVFCECILVTKEFTRLDEKGVLLPRKFSELAQEEKTEALPAIVLIKENKNGVIKGYACVDGRKKDCLSLLERQLHPQYLPKV